MKEFIVTFGQQYRNEPHEMVSYANPDGYLVVEALDEEHAREKAFKELGPYWSHCYPNIQEHTIYFPLGEIHRI